VAGALGLDRVRPVNRFDNLCPDACGICLHMAGDVVDKAGLRRCSRDVGDGEANKAGEGCSFPALWFARLVQRAGR
jgi:hypothetical protein